MLSDDALIDLVKASFEADVRSVTAPPDLPIAVRSQVQRRRRGVASAISGTAVAACTVAIVLAVTEAGPARPTNPAVAPGTGQGSANVGGTKLLRLSDFSFSVPATDPKSWRCLDEDWDSWTNSWSPAPGRRPLVFVLVIHGGNWGGDPHREPCDGAVFVASTKHPAAVDTVRAPGQRTVYIAAPTAKACVGYLALDARTSAAVARVLERPVGPQYYLIGETASGNGQSMLVTMFRQMRLLGQRVWPRPPRRASTPPGPVGSCASPTR